MTEGNVVLFAEDEISTGMDALKALALGAKGVCVGRPLMKALGEEKADGARAYLEKMTEELAAGMAYTGCGKVEDIDKTILRRRRF